MFEGLVIADLIANAGAIDTADPDLQWQSLILEVALYCAEGRVPDGGSHGSRFQQLWPESPAGVLLGAVPVLLLNLEPYGHRQAYITRWAEDLGLPRAAIIAVDELFAYLCHIHDLRHPRGISGQLFPEKDLRSMPLMATPVLATVQDLVQRVQGQFSLGLQVAQRWGWGSAHSGLVALVTALWGGGQSIPLEFRLEFCREFSRPSQGWGGATWSSVHRIQMLQLSDELYRLWSGVNGDVVQTGTGLSYRVAVSI